MTAATYRNMSRRPAWRLTAVESREAGERGDLFRAFQRRGIPRWRVIRVYLAFARRAVAEPPDRIWQRTVAPGYRRHFGKCSDSTGFVDVLVPPRLMERHVEGDASLGAAPGAQASSSGEDARGAAVAVHRGSTRGFHASSGREVARVAALAASFNSDLAQIVRKLHEKQSVHSDIVSLIPDFGWTHSVRDGVLVQVLKRGSEHHRHG